MAPAGLNLLDWKDPKVRTLHFGWMAFFLSFMIWFSHAPLMATIKQTMGLTTPQVKALLILNVALTIPARIVIGILVDRFGPRLIYSGLLIVCSFICFAFATAQTFEQLALARFALGLVGAGFVIGIRLVGEWFPARQVGLAEGIYGGWGNFGSSAAAMTLPTLALVFGGEEGWRLAIASTGVLAFVFGIVFYRNVRNTPKGSTYFKPRRTGGLEVTSRGDLFFYLIMNVPMYLTLGVLAWRLGPGQIALLGRSAVVWIQFGLVLLFVYQTWHIVRVNKEVFDCEVPEMHRYRFKQVAVLNIAYMVTFGSELAVVSMLPLYFLETFEGLSPVTAGLFASGFAFMNLVARPGGGWMSDRFGRRKTLATLIAGLTLGYVLLGQIESSWPILLVVLATMACSFFVQAGEGAVFAMVPLVKRRMTGQIAGMTGAYGNVGAVIFLTVLSFVEYSTFFGVIAGCAAVCFFAVQFMDEPAGQTAEIHEDGRVELIEVA